ncbi:MAG TPA: hypothetical protein VML75_08625 [Kofleriaceae bacterium]|nr:hypothetical protein [Kofleriaceae bacterium]
MLHDQRCYAHTRAAVPDLVRSSAPCNESARAKAARARRRRRPCQTRDRIALSVGGTTLVVWLALGAEAPFAVERMVTVMVIACPHALGLAVHLVVAVSTSLTAQNGLLIRDRAAFERARGLNAVIFDKIGSLTAGRFGVDCISKPEGRAADQTGFAAHSHRWRVGRLEAMGLGWTLMALARTRL